jgi:hypothetical protein
MEYRYTIILKYFKNLEFEYLVTYSFNRGQEFERVIGTDEYPDKDLHRTRLVDSGGEFNRTSEKMSIVGKGSIEYERLATIVSSKPNEPLALMCAPTYRDALVFYSKENKIVDVLNICFECHNMVTSDNLYVRAGENQFDALSTWFKQQGHNIRAGETLDLIKKLSAMRKRKNE